jgi:hypothetical protein
MEAFNRSARAISTRRERTAAMTRNARPLPSSNINPGISNSSVEGADPSSPIAELQLLASTPHLSATTPGCATEPPASVLTTVGAYPMLQSYATPFSVAQSTHGQRPAAYDPLGIPAQSQHWQANSTAFAEPQSTLQQQSIQPSVVQTTHGQHPAAHDSRTAAPANLAAPQPTLPHRFLPSHSTGRPVDYPLWEVPAPSNLMRWPPRSQYRCADNLRLSIWHKQITASWNNCKQPLTSHHTQPTSACATSGA